MVGKINRCIYLIRQWPG